MKVFLSCIAATTPIMFNSNPYDNINNLSIVISLIVFGIVYVVVSIIDGSKT